PDDPKDPKDPKELPTGTQGGSERTTILVNEDLTVPYESQAMSPAAAPQPESQPEGVTISADPAAAAPRLPHTGGNAMAFISAGMALAGLGTLLRRRS
ncbi:MAG TPA: hypothetical protein DEF34_03635, partial [Desulfotomaculum sp.]|nr:hypothetical protein [Desulfotomaculum sp.]